MNHQLLQCTSSEAPSTDALWPWDDELWDWTEGTFWPYPEGPRDIDSCLSGEDPSLSQAEAFMFPSTCQQILGTTEPMSCQYSNFQDYISPPAHISTATTQSYHHQQAYSFSLRSPTHSQTPSLDMSPIQSQGSPYSVELITTPATMDLSYIPPHQGDNLYNGLQLQDVLVPAAFTQQPANLTAEGLVGDHFPEDPQARPEMSYEQAQNTLASTDLPGHSPKLSARRRRRKDKPEECPICGKGHAYKTELDRHIRAQHKDQAEQHDLSVERFPCPHCPRDFARKDHLIRHLQRRHGLAKGRRRNSKN